MQNWCQYSHHNHNNRPKHDLLFAIPLPRSSLRRHRRRSRLTHFLHEVMPLNLVNLLLKHVLLNWTHFSYVRKNSVEERSK